MEIFLRNHLGFRKNATFPLRLFHFSNFYSSDSSQNASTYFERNKILTASIYGNCHRPIKSFVRLLERSRAYKIRGANPADISVSLAI